MKRILALLFVTYASCVSIRQDIKDLEPTCNDPHVTSLDLDVLDAGQDESESLSVKVNQIFEIHLREEQGATYSWVVDQG